MGQLTDCVLQAYNTALDRGLYADDVSFETHIARLHEELSEALMAYRSGMPPTATKPGYVGIPWELSDVCIYVFSLCGKYGIDIEEFIVMKLEYNKTRKR